MLKKKVKIQSKVNRPTKIIYPDNTYSEKTYVDNDNSILVWDENGHGMAYWYDAFGNLTKVLRGPWRMTLPLRWLNHTNNGF